MTNRKLVDAILASRRSYDQTPVFDPAKADFETTNGRTTLNVISRRGKVFHGCISRKAARFSGEKTTYHAQIGSAYGIFPTLPQAKKWMAAEFAQANTTADKFTTWPN